MRGARPQGDSEEAAALLRRFGGYAAVTSLGELQEAYTLAFDLDSLSESDPTCYPYVGHHLFEENHKRSAFILGLLERYREHGFADDTGDLPDHLVIVLRFLARCDDDELVAETIDEALLPALARMLGTVGGARAGERATALPAGPECPRARAPGVPPGGRVRRGGDGMEPARRQSRHQPGHLRPLRRRQRDVEHRFSTR